MTKQPIFTFDIPDSPTWYNTQGYQFVPSTTIAYQEFKQASLSEAIESYEQLQLTRALSPEQIANDAYDVHYNLSEYSYDDFVDGNIMHIHVWAVPTVSKPQTKVYELPQEAYDNLLFLKRNATFVEYIEFIDNDLKLKLELRKHFETHDWAPIAADWYLHEELVTIEPEQAN